MIWSALAWVLDEDNPHRRVVSFAHQLYGPAAETGHTNEFG